MSEFTIRLLLDARRNLKRGPEAITDHQQRRFSEIVLFARAHSSYYRELYRHLPDRIETPKILPVTSKKALMARFDQWVTDPEVSLEETTAFINNPELIGDKFLGKYTVATTSGTTGIPGIFLIDERTLAVTNAIAFRMLSSWLSVMDFTKIVARGGRMAMVMATGGHYASAVAAARLRKSGKWIAGKILALSVHTPLSKLVSELNKFDPVLVAPYASVAALLADEQELGRLHINPVLMTLSAEGLPESEYSRISRAFKTKVGNSYASTECMFLSYSCREGWLHVNSDWAILEPVDGNYLPTPPGEQSHTVLITNLANRVQPILRYDLGDSVLERPDRCPCGNPLPAIRVLGRSSDVLVFENLAGKKISIPPLALEIDDVPGVERFQIVQTSSKSISVRLRLIPGATSSEAWEKVHENLSRLFSEHGLGDVSIERGEKPPEQTIGGKYRNVIPLE